MDILNRLLLTSDSVITYMTHPIRKRTYQFTKVSLSTLLSYSTSCSKSADAENSTSNNEIKK